jgi:hypothetical protein
MAFNAWPCAISETCRAGQGADALDSPAELQRRDGAGGMATEGTACDAARDLGMAGNLALSGNCAGETFTLCDIEGEGAMQHTLLTLTGVSAARPFCAFTYWDDQEQPSDRLSDRRFLRECGWKHVAPVHSLACASTPQRFNSYWEMRFRKRCRVPLESHNSDKVALYYQVTTRLTDVAEGRGLLPCAVSPHKSLPFKSDYTIWRAC